MTHRPETAYKAYAVKNRRTDAAESVKCMKGIRYGEKEGSGDVACGDDTEAPDDRGYDDGNFRGEGRHDDRESTVPSSAGALERHDDRESTVPSSAGALERQRRRLRLSAEEEAAIGREARRMSFQGLEEL